MNLKNLSAAILAAMALASCSSEALVDEPAKQESAKGYLAVNVSLPTISGNTSRAPQYTDGTAAEYKVDNAVLLVFSKEGSTELDYKFVEATSISGLAPWNASSDAQITTSATGVASLSGNISLAAGAEYYGLVLLNNPATGGVTYPAVGQTYGAWLNTAQTPVIGTASLYMSNAPRYTSGVPQTLVKLDKSKIAASEGAATEPAASFFVERGVAKVTVTDASMSQKNVAGTTYSGDKVTIKKWALDVVNKSTYPVHNVDGLAASYADIWSNTGTSNPCTARFVGGNNTFMRTFWAKDPNYDKDVTSQAMIEASFNVLTMSALAASDNVGKALYCFENTFDVYHMMQGQTTRVVFKALYQPQGLAEGETFYRIGSQAELYSFTQLNNLIAQKAASAFSTSLSNVTVNLGTDVTGTAGNHALKAEMVKIGGNALTSDQLNVLVRDLAAQGGINTYLNGECYYVARIKHFGDAETPWNMGDPTYNGDNLKYLGRYGMVRNNWYELNVGTIRVPGSSVIPTIDPVRPDDESDRYITVNVNVLPWAKRVQEVDL